jgi:cyclophilin family peptidyl-prolyl cis-trans isomerase
MNMSRILTLAAAILAVLVVAAQDKPAAAPLELTISPMSDSVSLGDSIQIEAVLKNTSDKPVEIPPLVFDERSLSFSVKAETTPGMTKSFDYSIVTGSLYTVAPPPLEKVKLAPGKSFVSAFNLPATMVGTWAITGKFNGLDAAVTSKPVNVKVGKKDGKDKLSVKLTVTFDAKDKDVMIDLLPEAAPASVMHFVSLVNRGFYKGLKIVEVVKGNWIRTGCPNNDGFGDAGYTYRSENKEQEATNKTLVFESGVVALNQQQKMGFQSSQFFITIRRINFLDFKFTIIGKVDSEGLQIVKDAAAKADPDRETNRPKNDITVKDATVVIR